MSTIVTVVGNRPQFIKMAPMALTIRKNGCEDIIIHTGQHYDENLSQIFFQEMNIPKPKIQLKVDAKKPGAMVASILLQLEQQFETIAPQGIIVYGDTNSTLAAALAAAKLNIPIAHIEAGPRTFDKTSPEEINRICTDHLALLNFVPDAQSQENLYKEGLANTAILSGDIMYDAFLNFREIARKKSKILEKVNINFTHNKVALLTIHRQENTISKSSLENLFAILEAIPHITVFPMHPRFIAFAEKENMLNKFKLLKNLILLPALGYLDILNLLDKVDVILTDSGGLQKEAYFSEKPCCVFVDVTPWPLLEKHNYQQVLGFLSNLSIDDATSKIKNQFFPPKNNNIFGFGKASEKIFSKLRDIGWF